MVCPEVPHLKEIPLAKETSPLRKNNEEIEECGFFYG